jgi:hypothetical protein
MDIIIKLIRNISNRINIIFTIDYRFIGYGMSLLVKFKFYSNFHSDFRYIIIKLLILIISYSLDGNLKIWVKLLNN